VSLSMFCKSLKHVKAFNLSPSTLQLSVSFPSLSFEFQLFYFYDDRSDHPIIRSGLIKDPISVQPRRTERRKDLFRLNFSFLTSLRTVLDTNCHSGALRDGLKKFPARRTSLLVEFHFFLFQRIFLQSQLSLKCNPHCLAVCTHIVTHISSTVQIE
jgi:hypothetical protein